MCQGSFRKECQHSGRSGVVQAGPKYAFGDEGREGCPPGSKVDMVIELLHLKAVKTIDPDHEGLVVKTILKDGAAHQCPNDSAEVCVSWTGKLADGTEFDKVRFRLRAAFVTVSSACMYRSHLPHSACCTRYTCMDPAPHLSSFSTVRNIAEGSWGGVMCGCSASLTGGGGYRWSK